MEDFVEDVKKAWGDLSRGARELTEQTAEKIQRYRRLQQLSAEIKNARARRQDIFVLMGRKVYALHKKGKVANKDLLKQCEEIDELLRTVEKCQAEIDRIRAHPAEEDVEVEDESPIGDDGPAEANAEKDEDRAEGLQEDAEAQ
ncbi:MAG: hypothetical protein ACE5O2_00785 [Armatimonadota bacterium]